MSFQKLLHYFCRMWRILVFILISANAQSQTNSLKNCIHWFDHQQTDSLVTMCLKTGFTLSGQTDSVNYHLRSFNSQTVEGIERNCYFVTNDSALIFISWDYFGHAEQRAMDAQLQALRFKKQDARMDGDFITTAFDNGSFIVEEQYQAVDIPGTNDQIAHFRYQLYRKHGAFDQRNGVKELYETDVNGKRFLAWKETVQNGLLNGPRIGYYPSGKIRLEENYVNGRLSGKQNEYTESGVLSHSATYSYHWHYGPEKWFNQDGEVIRSVNWQRNVKTGQEIEKKNGKIVRLITYKQGIPNGKAILPIYSHNQDSLNDFPAMLEETTFLKGQKNGRFVHYNSGTKDTVVSGTYLNNQRHGVLLIYASGNLWFEYNYINGVMSGESFTYVTMGPSKGKVLMKQFWKNGLQDSTELLLLTEGINVGDTALIQNYKKGKIHGLSSASYYLKYGKDFTMNWIPYTRIAHYDEYGLTGNYLLDYPDSLHLEGEYRYNKKDGSWTEIRKINDRTDHSESNYKNGVLDGSFKRTIPNLYSEMGQYVNGLKEGKWNITGDTLKQTELQTEMNYREGKLNGIRSYSLGGRCIQQDSLSKDQLVRTRFLNNTIQTTYQLDSVSFDELKVSFLFQQQRYDTLISCKLELETNDVLNHPVFFKRWKEYFVPDVLPVELIRGPVMLETDSLLCYSTGMKLPGDIYWIKYKSSGITQEVITRDGIQHDYFSINDQPFSGTFYSGMDRCEYRVKNGLLNGWVTYSDVNGKTVKRSRFKAGVLKKTETLNE